MYLLGHIGFSILILYLYERINDISFTLRRRLMIAIGSMLPDFLDKPIGSLFFETGRWLGHSIFFQFLVMIVLLFVSRISNPYPEYKSDIWIWYFGATLHVLEDMPSMDVIVLFYPLLGPIPRGNASEFLHGFQNLHTVITEILGFCLILFFYKYENWGSQSKKVIIGTLIGYFILFLVTYAILVGF